MIDDWNLFRELHYLASQACEIEQDADRKAWLRAVAAEAQRRQDEVKCRAPDVYPLSRHKGIIFAGAKDNPIVFKEPTKCPGIDYGYEILRLGPHITKQASDFVGRGSRAAANNLRNHLRRAAKVFDDNGCPAIARAYHSISITNDGRITINRNPHEIIELGLW